MPARLFAAFLPKAVTEPFVRPEFQYGVPK